MADLVDGTTAGALRRTPLAALHEEFGARMVPFAGYAMPLQYDRGIIREHLACRASAALFDVSHMGQAVLSGPGAVAALEALTPCDVAGLAVGQQRYAVLTNAEGGIADDLLIARLADDRLFLVVNASRKEADFALIARHLPATARLERQDDRALIALQGPMAEAMLSRLAPSARGIGPMRIAPIAVSGTDILIARGGYTGEDGFELSIAADAAAPFVRRLLAAEPGLALAGLGARDSLRLEAGLCLYGQDIDATTTPVEAGLAWTIGTRRRRAADFLGAGRILAQLAEGPALRRVGLRPEGRAVARAGTAIAAPDGAAAGRVTSGTFAPSLGAPIAMGYVPAHLAEPGTTLALSVRGQALPARVVPLPFLPHRRRGDRHGRDALHQGS